MNGKNDMCYGEECRYVKYVAEDIVARVDGFVPDLDEKYLGKQAVAELTAEVSKKSGSSCTGDDCECIYEEDTNAKPKHRQREHWAKKYVLPSDPNKTVIVRITYQYAKYLYIGECWKKPPKSPEPKTTIPN